VIESAGPPLSPQGLAAAALAALCGGALNAIAGGGTFITFPTLLALGVPPVVANATSTVALAPGGLGAAWGYRGHLRQVRHLLPALCGASVLGGAAGAWLLVSSGDDSFARLVPWLIGAATLLFAFAPRLVAWARAARPSTPRVGVAMVATQLAIAVYGGYFGGGMGILMIAAFALAGIADLHAANGVKSLQVIAVNGAAIAVFAGAGPVHLQAAPVMTASALAGGYLGARIARRTPLPWLRWAIAAAGAALTIAFAQR